jgi:hypothetical protein
MTNFTYYYDSTVSNLQNSSGFQFLIHGLLVILIITALVLAFLWYDSREEMEDGYKVFNPMKFSKKLKNICCFPESCQSSMSKCFILLGVIGSSYLEVLQEDEAVRETRTLEKLMEARKSDKKKKRGSSKSSRGSSSSSKSSSRNSSSSSSSSSSSHNINIDSNHNNNEYFSDDGESVHSGHGLL